MPRIAHVIQGRWAAGNFAQAMQPQPEELLVSEDVLSCGPLPPFESVEEWARLREAYWDSIGPSDDRRPFNRDLLANAQALRELDLIVVWIGTGTAEQLLLAWMVKLLKLVGSQAQLQVVQFTRIGKHNENVWGLGLLKPEQFKQHPPAEPVSAQTLFGLERRWDRVTSPDPAGLLAVLSEETAHLPHSRASLERLIHRYPDHQTGLGRWESELLRRTKEKGPRAARVIAEVMALNFDADLVGDGVLFARLRQLASSDLAHPLVTLSGDPYDIHNCQIALTDAGESVLAARANAVELNGIDDWVLGVHLDSKRGSVWYHKAGTLVT